MISLDFELHWGVRDKKDIHDYKENLLGVRSVVPSILKLFDEYQIHATWATVGFLFFKTRDELTKSLPVKRPNYIHSILNPYNHINEIGSNEDEDPFHYAPSLIEMITRYPNQEVGSHTFSHYYCLEKGQDIDTFKYDLHTAVKTAERYGIIIQSLVFPRNQFNSEYINICRELGIKSYRGNQLSWIYKAQSEENESLLRRGLRLIDSYFCISGHNSYHKDTIKRDFPFNIPSSRFLRPYSNILRIMDYLRLQRIASDLKYAAKKGLVYHLWWHPHNFGINTEKNLTFLKKILNYYLILQRDYGMESLNMAELCRSIEEDVNYER